MKVSAFEIFLVVVSVIAVVLTATALGSPEWMEISSYYPAFYTQLSIQLGLFKQCSTVTSPNPTKPTEKVTTESCGSDGADDWQKIAAGLAIASLVLSVLTAVLAFIVVFVPRVKGSLKVKYPVAFSQFLTAGCMTATLILYVYNDHFILPAPFFEAVTLNISWGYFVGCAAAPVSAIAMLCTIVNIIVHTNLAKHEKVRTSAIMAFGSSNN